MRSLLVILILAAALAVPVGAQAHILSESRAQQAGVAFAQGAYRAGTGFEPQETCVRYTRHRLHCRVAFAVPPQQACEITLRVRYVNHRSSRPRVSRLDGLFCEG